MIYLPFRNPSQLRKYNFCLLFRLRNLIALIRRMRSTTLNLINRDVTSQWQVVMYVPTSASSGTNWLCSRPTLPPPQVLDLVPMLNQSSRVVWIEVSKFMPVEQMRVEMVMIPPRWMFEATSLYLPYIPCIFNHSHGPRTEGRHCILPYNSIVSTLIKNLVLMREKWCSFGVTLNHLFLETCVRII